MKKYFLIIFLMFTCLSMSAQVHVKGNVKAGDDGQPMVGVSIFEKGTLNGVITDLDGNYSIQVKGSSSVLVFSSTGFKTKEVTVGSQGVIDLVLDVDNQLLDEIVVVGYSTKTRGEITSAVTTVSADKLQDVVSNNIGDMLQGKVAGVSVVKSSGMPGEAPSIRIRGTSSMNASSEPLYVVDGIIGGSFDPDDVENVTILKDAGSTGMYGAQANGGVIVVTTKRAKQEKMVFNFKANFGLSTPDFSRQGEMGSEMLRTYYREYFRDPETYLVDDLAFNAAMPAEMLKNDTNWRGLVFQNALTQNYHFSVMGRSDKNSYYNSISYYDEEGTLKNTDFKRINIRSNNTYKLTKWLNVTNNINVSANMSNRPDDLLVYYVGVNIPFDSPYDENGNLVTFKTNPIYGRYDVNPLIGYFSDNLVSNAKGFGVDYDLIIDAKITPWLSFVSQTRANLGLNASHYHRYADVEYMQAGDAVRESMAIDYGGITTNMFKAEGKWGAHSLNGLIGYEAQMSWFEDVNASGQGLPSGLSVLSVVSKNKDVSGTKAKTGMQSIISQANYNFDQRYFLTASLRVDQSSTFNSANRTAVFPSVSGAWVVSNEKFFSSDLISNLKLKASWGKTGMKDIGASKYLEAFLYSTQYNGNSAATPSQMANPNLKWEQTTQMNVGAEIGITDRVSIDLNWYRNTTDDLLIYRDLPPTGGFSKQWQNFGSVLNTGFETSLDVTPVKTSDFQWDVNFSLSYNFNKLFNFGDAVITMKNYSGLTQIYRDGIPMYTWLIPEYAGIDPQTGRPQYVDEKGNKTFSYKDAREVEMGTPLIPWQGGVASYFTYKNFKLSATGSFVWGDTLYGLRRASGLHSFIEGSMLPSNDDVIWRKPGDQATIALPTYAPGSLYHSGKLVRGDYFKLRNITLSYALPKSIMKDNSLVLSLSCDNVFTATTVWGADPEVGITPGGTIAGEIQGLDYRYPNKKQVVFQVNFTF